jgi:hypothetical protein
MEIGDLNKTYYYLQFLLFVGRITTPHKCMRGNPYQVRSVVTKLHVWVYFKCHGTYSKATSSLPEELD